MSPENVKSKNDNVNSTIETNMKLVKEIKHKATAPLKVKSMGPVFTTEIY